MKTILSSTLIALSLSRRYCSSAFTTTSTPAASIARKAFLSTIGTGACAKQGLSPSLKTTSLQMSSSSSPPQIISIDKSQMNEIIQTVEESPESSEYVIIDVRNVDEINYTGKLSPVVETLPLPYIVQYGVFNLDNEDFEEQFGFPKPDLDKTIVFTCKAGIRSMHAAQFAAEAGYTNMINYGGGADDWFR